MKDPVNWPEAMRVEYGDDAGRTAVARHRDRLVSAFRKVREEIDDFGPDFILIWGDDQYENFKEDIIPAFCVKAYDKMECRPFVNPFNEEYGSGKKNVWAEPPGKVFEYQGFPVGARSLASGLIEQGFDIAYSYKPLHHPGLGHAFLNTLLY